MINNAFLRRVRKEKKITLVKLSKESGYSSSFLSLIERGLREPSLSALRKIADCLGVSVVMFFIDDSAGDDGSVSQPYTIIRREGRKVVELPGIQAKCNMITPVQTAAGQNSSNRMIEGFFYALSPGEWCSEKLISHTNDESVYVISGNMKACLGDDTHYLKTGDSIYIYTKTPHNFQNCGQSELSLLMYIIQEM